MIPRFVAIALLASAVSTIGCYKPNIEEGTFLCAAGHVCPDGFKCASNGRCYSRDAGSDVPVKPPVCNSVTPDASTCSRDLTATGQACSPACESGCSCGWCAVVHGTPMCVTGTPGSKQAGAVCDPSSATQCAPGLFCRAECGTGHCYKYCESNSDCPVSGSTCTLNGVDAVGATKLCSVPQPQCDAIKNTGCLDGFTCFFTGTATTCDCPGTEGEGGSCRYADDCMPGYSCVNRGQGDAGATCVKVCQSGASCSSSQTCIMVGNYGYCL